jgi:hypothetical protein
MTGRILSADCSFMGSWKGWLSAIETICPRMPRTFVERMSQTSSSGQSIEMLRSATYLMVWTILIGAKLATGGSSDATGGVARIKTSDVDWSRAN